MRVSFPFKPAFTVLIRSSVRPQRGHTGPDITPPMVECRWTTFRVGNSRSVPPNGYSIKRKSESVLRERLESLRGKAITI